MELNKKLIEILNAAYKPCSELEHNCNFMKWEPTAGFIPRGFLGATGTIEEVKLVLVCAEPGDPHDGETHTGMESAYEYAYHAFETRMDAFHKNIRLIMNMCWPDLSFDERLRKVWITNSILCSVNSRYEEIPQYVEKKCAEKFLLPQLKLFPNALIVAMGNKAEKRMKNIGVIDFISVDSAAAPGGNTVKAKESWKKIPVELK